VGGNTGRNLWEEILGVTCMRKYWERFVGGNTGSNFWQEILGVIYERKYWE
jgi:hypothetical protein